MGTSKTFWTRLIQRKKEHCRYRCLKMVTFVDKDVAKWSILAACLSGVLAIVYGIIVAVLLLKKDAGNAKMQKIAGSIQEGARAFLVHEYKHCCSSLFQQQLYWLW